MVARPARVPRVAGWTRPSPPRRASVLGIWSFVVGGGLVPLAISLSSGGARDQGLLPLATVVLVLYSSLRLSLLIADGEPRILAGVFWLFVYVAMAVAPFAQVELALFPALADPETLVPATLLVLAGCLAYDLGYHAARRRSPSGLIVARPAHTVSAERLTLIGCSGLLASGYYIFSVGGFGVFFTSRRDLADRFNAAGLRSEGSQVGSALVATLGTVPILLAWLALTCVVLRRSETRRPAVLAVWCVLTATNTVVNNPISNPRYWFLTVFIGGFFALPGLGRGRFRIALLAGSFLALVLFPYADYFRSDPSTRGPTSWSSPTTTLATKDYDQMTMTANTISWVRESGYTEGRQLLGDALFWIPRNFWPGKPNDTGVVIGRELGGPNVNLSSPLWAELWIDFGLAGVLVGFPLYGYLGGRLDDVFVGSLDRRRPVVDAWDVGLPLLAGYQFILLRGPLLQSMSRLSVMVLFLWLMSRRTTGARKSTGHADTRPCDPLRLPDFRRPQGSASRCSPRLRSTPSSKETDPV